MRLKTSSSLFCFQNKEENTMIINIWKKQDLELVKELPTEVLATIEDTIEILDENYGTERTAEEVFLRWLVREEAFSTTSLR